MAKKTAVVAVNPVNGFGLFQYLEAFYENGIPFTVFSVSESKIIKTNSGIILETEETVSNLKKRTDEFDALVFACGDAMPKFSENADKEYNRDMMEVISLFGNKDKLIIGHCVGGLLFELAGIAKGKKISLHPLLESAIKNAIVAGKDISIDSNLYTAKTENTLCLLIPEIIRALKD